MWAWSRQQLFWIESPPTKTRSRSVSRNRWGSFWTRPWSRLSRSTLTGCLSTIGRHFLSNSRHLTLTLHWRCKYQRWIALVFGWSVQISHQCSIECAVDFQWPSSRLVQLANCCRVFRRLWRRAHTHSPRSLQWTHLGTYPGNWCSDLAYKWGRELGQLASWFLGLWLGLEWVGCTVLCLATGIAYGRRGKSLVQFLTRLLYNSIQQRSHYSNSTMALACTSKSPFGRTRALLAAKRKLCLHLAAVRWEKASQSTLKWSSFKLLSTWSIYFLID